MFLFVTSGVQSLNSVASRIAPVLLGQRETTVIAEKGPIVENQTSNRLQELIEERFGGAPESGVRTKCSGLLEKLAERGSCRSFSSDAVSLADIERLCALALASPTKSDLQQRDIVIVTDSAMQGQMAQLVATQEWIASAPVLLVFCGNNRRQRFLHEWKSVPFANDHLDAFFNATVDAAIALATFITAAEAVGFGCCPISAVRNEAKAISEMLGLPDHVFPVAGLAVGIPAKKPEISKRLPLNVTLHRNQYKEAGLRETMQAYSKKRAQAQPYPQQRLSKELNHAEEYDWIEDKVRQFSRKERAEFGRFIRGIGFSLT